jgi:hypothetical protein
VPLKSPALPESSATSGASPKPSLAASLGNYKRDSYNGYGNGLAKAFEITMTPALFGGIGYLIDRRTDTKPWFTVGFVCFALVGMFIKMWFSYDEEMKHHEKSMVTGHVAGRADARESAAPTSAAPTSAVVRESFADHPRLPTGVTLEAPAVATPAAPAGSPSETAPL